MLSLESRLLSKRENLSTLICTLLWSLTPVRQLLYEPPGCLLVGILDNARISFSGVASAAVVVRRGELSVSLAGDGHAWQTG